MNNWVAASPYTVVDSLLKEKTFTSSKDDFVFFLHFSYFSKDYEIEIILKGETKTYHLFFIFFFKTTQHK